MVYGEGSGRFEYLFSFWVLGRMEVLLMFIAISLGVVVGDVFLGGFVNIRKR